MTKRKDEKSIIPEEFVEFQPDSVVIESRRMPVSARLFLYSVACFIVLAISWASMVEIDRVVTAQGKLILSSQPIVVQPLEKAVIREFHVNIGDKVEEGQQLVTLDPTVAVADFEQLKEKQDSLAVHMLRLQCELEGKPFDPPETFPAGEISLQRSIYERRKVEYKSRFRSWNRQTAQIQAEIKTIKASIEQVKRQLAMSREIDEIYTSLYDKGVSSRLETLNARSRRYSHESEIEQLRNRILQEREQLRRIQADRETFVSSWTSQAYQELLTVRRQLDEVEKQVEKAEWYSKRVRLDSPRDGIVLEMAELSEGSVVNQAETLIKLVPEGAEILAEAEVLNRDIGYIRSGDDVRIKLEAFPFQEHGIIKGRVSTISEDSFKEEAGYGPKEYYRVRIALESTMLENVPADFRLIPGMTLTAEIKVGKRTVISYFLYPIIRAFDETMREP